MDLAATVGIWAIAGAVFVGLVFIADALAHILEQLKTIVQLLEKRQ